MFRCGTNPRGNRGFFGFGLAKKAWFGFGLAIKFSFGFLTGFGVLS